MINQAHTCTQCGYPTRFAGRCMSCIAADFDLFEDGADEIDDDGYDDCGLMPDGQCTRAGTEECDWDCGRLS